MRRTIIVYAGLLTALGFCALVLPRTPGREGPVQPQEAQRAGVKQLAGSILARFDTAKRLNDKLAAQKVATAQAAAALAEAEGAADVAKVALKEYEDGVLPQEREATLGEIQLSESVLAGAKDRVDWSKRMVKKGTVTQGELLRDRSALQNAEMGLSNAKRKLDLLEKFTGPKTITDRKVAIEKAEANIAAKKDAFSGEKAKEADLTRQLEEASPTDQEGHALVLLDGAIRLQDQHQPDEARAKLDQAAEIWRGEEARRAERRYIEMTRRIHAIAGEINKHEPPR